MTQSERVLQYLRQHGTITQDQADRQLGIRRLAARIHDLRADGHEIEADQVEVRNRYGEICRIASYSLTAALDRDDMGSPEPERPDGLLFDTQKYIASHG